MKGSDIIEFLIFGKITPKAQKLRRAAEKGNANAQFKLGMLYYTGPNSLQNKRQAIHWFHPAAIRGCKTAQRSLGETRLAGHGIYKSYESAYAWIRLAAAGGCESAAERLEMISKEMTPEEVEEAILLSQELEDRIKGIYCRSFICLGNKRRKRSFWRIKWRP